VLKQISIENYKSIKKVDIEIKNINILIGSNGAGKSNFISFFKLLNAIIREKLQDAIAQESGANNVFHHGLKVSEYISGSCNFSNKGHNNTYSFILKANNTGGVYFGKEIAEYSCDNESHQLTTNSGWSETSLHRSESKNISMLIARLQELKIYHFHDTSKSAGVKQSFNIQDNEYLYEDARNLASFLFKLQQKEPKILERIVQTIRLIAPYFEEFVLKPDIMNEENIKLGWREKNSEMLFNASHLSDGTLRMICLITLFLQPNPPKIILIDEPELGLHPYALTVLSDLIKKVAINGTQVIVSTQSVPLLDNFTIDDIIVAEKRGNESQFIRPDKEFLKAWMDEYSLGQLWDMNLLGGRP